MITVRIPTPLRTLTGGNEQVDVEGATVRDVIDALERKGIVGPYEGSKSRAVVATPMDLETIFEGNGTDGRDEEGW